MKNLTRNLTIALVILGSGALTAFAAPIYQLQRSILPETTDTYNLGSTSPALEWNGVFTKNITLGTTTPGCLQSTNAGVVFSTGVSCGTGSGGSSTAFFTSTTGTDFSVSTTSTTATLNLPVASATTTGKVAQYDFSTFWNSIFPRGSGAYIQTASTSAAYQYATSTYQFDDFGQTVSRWGHTSSGSMTFTPAGTTSPAYLTAIAPASGDTIATRNLWSNILTGYDTLDFDVNFNGNSLLTAGDTPRLGFDQSGGEWIVLTNFATNGVNGWQHISIPLSKITSNGDATPSTAGTGTHLDPTVTVSSFQLRVYDTVAGNSVSIRNAVLSDSTHTIVQDFTQPDIFSASKPGNSIFKIQSTDFMKVSKDNVTSQYTDTQMNSLVTAVRPLNLNYIAIDTPYDDCSAYSPVVACGYATRWANSVRAGGYNIFWRQHWNSWEGDYKSSGFTKATSTTIALGTAAGVINGSDTSSYLYKEYNYIATHANQYAPGDIITPIAEPENAGINGGTTCYKSSDSGDSGTTGSGYCQFPDKNTFIKFLEDSITVTNAALQKIGLKGRVYVGFYGNSANIINGTGGGKPFIDDRLVDGMGIVTMDDYPNPVSNLSTDLTAFEGLYSSNRPMMITEFGTINDTSTSTRVTSLGTYMDIMKSKPYMLGFNYWTVNAGANEILLDSNNNPVGAFRKLQEEFTSGKTFAFANCLGSIWLGSCVNLASSSAPTIGQVLTAFSSTSAGWVTPVTTSSGSSATSPATSTNPLLMTMGVATSTTATSTFAGGFAVQGTSFVVQSSTGNIGIGTLTPAYPVQMRETNAGVELNLLAGSNANSILQQFDNGNTLKLGVEGSAGTTMTGSLTQAGILDMASNGSLQLGTNNIAQLTILGSGNTGLGTTSPYAKLSVVGQVVGAYFSATTSTASTLPYASTTALTVSGLASTTDLYVSNLGNVAGTFVAADPSGHIIATSSPIGIGTTGQFPYYAANGNVVTATSSIFIASSGRVGINQTSPSLPLDVNGLIKSLGMTLYDDSTEQIAGSWGFNIGGNSTHPIRFPTAGVVIGDTGFFSGGSSINQGTLIIQKALGIGTTTPYAALSVGSTTNSLLAFVVATSTGNDIGGYDNDGHRFSSGPSPTISSCGTGTGTVVGDDQSGTVTTATAATACTVTFSKAYQKTPICTVTDNSLVGFADVSSISTTAVTFGISSALTGGNLYYNCTYHR